MKGKFLFSAGFGLLWLGVSMYFSIFWAQEAAQALPELYVWWAIIGIALLPGFLMSAMFFSNLIHWRLKKYPSTAQATTVLMCAYNEQETIAQAIQAILDQEYLGAIRLLVIDNGSTDNTKQEILRMQQKAKENRMVEYLFCAKPGKANALNCGLAQVHTPFFLTVDADTFLEKRPSKKLWTTS
ncbi:glycosyltransferase family 2 protein [uncultured Ruthenibacterium sp.]|uniref:glycosyltransferase family 2 protein n=1 Tax=uncultured Ruthenibacterium sp. TaxID=1905347 RepID=UPI00349EEBD1